MAFGIDFGTSNSAVAFVDKKGKAKVARFRAVELDQTSSTAPTVLFFPSYQKDTHYGHEAVRTYLFNGLEGRFIQSMKTFLPAKSFAGTQIRGQQLEIEDLVALYLKKLLAAAEASMGVSIREDVVLGRPARFSLDPEADALAEARLIRGAERAGLSGFRLQIEPVAAALAYEASLDRDEVVLVADLGGGTSDFTVMRVGPKHQALTDRRQSILASRGVPIAGDKLDAEIVRAALLPLFGQGSSYVAFTDLAPVPNWIFHELLAWNHVSFLKSKKTLEFLRLVARTSDNKPAIQRLLRVVEEDQGYLLFRAVERAKRTLSTDDRAMIEDAEHGLAVEAEVKRETFDRVTLPLVEQIWSTALECLAAAGLEPRAVDAVFMTGGTSLLPAVRERFFSTFGEKKIRSGDNFTSVVEGLARA
ncbi:MAG: Hsp70 family protein [Myxococcota bacterium]